MSSASTSPTAPAPISNKGLTLQTLAEIVGRKLRRSHEHISIEGVNFTAIDHKFAFGLNEDKEYTNDEFRFLLPRGLCAIYVGGELITILAGHPKFGYEGNYPVQKPASKWVYTRKENGECAHFSAFLLDGKGYFVIGSKNVHLIVRWENFIEDLASAVYAADRYLFAKKIAKVFYDEHNAIFEHVFDFMIKNEVTLCAESIFMDNPHMVDYQDLKRDELRFFAITHVRETADSPITWCNPIIAKHHFEALGLKTVCEIREISTPEELESVKDLIAREENSEGGVITCLDEDGKSFYAFKHKNDQYVIFRLVREKICEVIKAIKEKKSHRVIARLEAGEGLEGRVQNLHINPENLGELLDVEFQFFGYCMAHKQELEDEETFRSNYIFWRSRFHALTPEEKSSFDVRKQKLDAASLSSASTAVKQKQPAKIPDSPKTDESVEKSGNKFVIMLSGIQGSGKSTLARLLRNLAILLGFSSDSIVHLEQDFFSSHGKRMKYAYHDAIKAALDNNNIKIIILAKMQHTVKSRDEVSELIGDRNVTRLLVVLPPKGMDFHLARIKSRGAAHSSLHPSDKLGDILERSKAEFEMPTGAENCSILTLDIAIELYQNLVYIIEFLKHNNALPKDFGFTIEQFEVALLRVNEDDARLALEHTTKASMPVALAKAAAPQKPLYDGIDISLPPEILESITIPENQIRKNKFHITVKYYGGRTPGDKKFIRNVVVHLYIIGYVQDKKATALLCIPPESIKVESGLPHITFALAQGVAPVYCKTLTQNKEDETVTCVMFEEPIKCKGLTFTEFNK